MNRSKGYNSIFAFVVVLLLIVVFIEYGKGFISNNSGAYSTTSFAEDIKAGKVAYATIMPNAETPTGAVKVNFNDGTEEVTFYTTDVTVIEKLLTDNGIKHEVEDVPSDNILITGIIPVIVGLVVMVFIFTMFTNM